MQNDTLPAVQTALIPTDHELVVYATMAKQAVASGMYKGAGSEAAIQMKMLAARELGLPPMLALNKGLNVIQGSVEISARAMNAMIRRAGHSIQERTSTDTTCELVGTRRDNGDTCTASFTIEEATRAGLVKSGGAWATWPKDMLYARALSRLARRLFADVIGSAYVEGEIIDSKSNGAVLEPLRDAECEVVDTEHALTVFLERFSEASRPHWRDYVHAIQKKQHVTITQIADKYDLDPEAASQKFAAWIKKRESATS